MPTLIQILERINASYLLKLELKSLHSELDELDALIANPMLLDSVKQNAEALRLRLDAKICFLRYMDGFQDGDYTQATEHYKANIATAQEKGYGKTVAMIEEVQGFTVRICGIVQEVWQQRRIFDTNAATVLDGPMCDKAVQTVVQARELLELCNLTVATPNLQLGDLKRIVSDYLDASEKIFVDTRKSFFAKKIATSVKDITSTYRSNAFFPLPENDEGGKANALVLSTPLIEDARLFAVNQLTNGAKLQCVAVYNLPDKSVDFFKTLLSFIHENNDHVIMEGVDTLPVETSDELLLEAMRVGRLGTKVYLVDTTGKASLYKQALSLASKANSASITDISLEYISLPLFAEVKQLFEDKEMADPSNSGDILKKMTFMGFEGLNKVVQAYVSGNKNWQEVGKHASNINRQAVLNYLQHIVAPYLIIDSGWGDFSEYEKEVDGGLHEFDYDGVKAVDLANVKLIVESNETVFAKCGMIARYCTVGSDDISAWQKLSREEMLERITMTVKLVYKILHINIDPMVELLDELSNPTAGGLCCDGGKLIQFKYSCSLNLEDWLWHSIVHECFHSLQNKLTSGQWHVWYYENMGITRGRVIQWRKTREIYDHDTRSKVYTVHMYEADARAFESDCDDGRSKAWNSMNFR